MAKSPANNAAQRVRKKVRKNVSDGIAHVHASFNNTIITITDRQGNAPVSYTHLTLPTTPYV